MVYKKNSPRNTLQLNKNDVAGLVKALSNDNMFWRTTAQRLLVEKQDKSVLPALYKLVQNEQLDGAGINAPAIHALWTIHGLKAMTAARAITTATSNNTIVVSAEDLPRISRTLMSFP